MMESHFHIIIFLSLLIFGPIHEVEGVTNEDVVVVSPKERPHLGNNFCMVQTEKRNTTCCVCPDSCGVAYPRKPVGSYFAGLSVLFVSFRINGQINNSNIHLYLCPRNTTNDHIYQDCLLKNPLRIINMFNTSSFLRLGVEIPTNITCSHCLVQWAITKADNPTTTHTKQYYGCFDIAILSSDAPDSQTDPSVEPGSGIGDSQTSMLSTLVGSTDPHFQTSHGKTTRVTTVLSCWAVGVHAKNTSVQEYCKTVCPRQIQCSIRVCRCAPKLTTSLGSSTTGSTTTGVSTTPKLVCQAIGVYATVNGMDEWCQNNCVMGYCPKTHCECTQTAQGGAETSTLAATTQKRLFCRAIGIWVTVPGMHKWCVMNCRRNYCPASHCKCSSSNTLTTMPDQSISTTTSRPFSSRVVNSTTVSTTASSAKPLTDIPTASTNTPSLPSRITAKKQFACRATGIWVTVPGMHRWCVMNCRRNYCPSTHCKCSTNSKTTLLYQSTYTNANTFSSRLVNPTTADQIEDTTKAIDLTPVLPM